MPDIEQVLTTALHAGRGVLLFGGTGTGKTTALAHHARPLVQARLPAVSSRTRHLWLDRKAIWAHAADYVDDVKAEIGLSRRSDFTDFSDAFSASGIARGVQVLFLDDVGAETDTPYGRGLIETLIEARSRAAKGHITHVTTNLTLGEISTRYSPRMASRLVGMCEPYCVAGDDRRMRRFA